MARVKGQKMTEEQKAIMRAKREAKKQSKDASLKTMISNLNHLSFTDLEELIAYALRMRKEKMGQEELRLIKEREEIEIKIKKLKEMDKK
ncbi:hypothetical protein [Parabacteroides sp. PF5-9]|uniref:hypothetical protein n=1 Tax=Parabacteroides sp. PF5-9 TaxID=1742404 RepID=UPI0024763920|nr:hypothetical protein [Parabacteroides sp. PF5-9]MDH6356430.1 hypothetical protein [Parabacteroides sp. PF5-9]